MCQFWMTRNFFQCSGTRWPSYPNLKWSRRHLEAGNENWFLRRRLRLPQGYLQPKNTFTENSIREISSRSEFKKMYSYSWPNFFDQILINQPTCDFELRKPIQICHGGKAKWWKNKTIFGTNKGSGQKFKSKP